MRHIVSVNKYSGSDLVIVKENLHRPMDLKFFHHSTQYNGTNYCQVAEGRQPLCQQFCAPKPFLRNATAQNFRLVKLLNLAILATYE